MKYGQSSKAKPNGLSQLETRHQCQSNWRIGMQLVVSMIELTSWLPVLLPCLQDSTAILSSYKMGWNSNLYTEQQRKLLSFAGSEWVHPSTGFLFMQDHSTWWHVELPSRKMTASSGGSLIKACYRYHIWPCRAGMLLVRGNTKLSILKQRQQLGAGYSSGHVWEQDSQFDNWVSCPQSIKCLPHITGLDY